MEFQGIDHVFDCIPPVLNIRARWEVYKAQLAEWKKTGGKESEKPEEVKPVIIGMRFVTVPERDEEVFFTAKQSSEKSPEEAQRALGGFTKSRVKEKVAYIKNLIVDGKEITDFDTFYENAPPEIVSWVCKAVYSSYLLSEYEIKN